MRTLLVVEHFQQQLNANGRHALMAAQQLGQPIDILLAAEDAKSMAQSLSCWPGVERLLLADHAVYAHQQAEAMADLILHCSQGYANILAASGSMAKACLPRVAAALNTNMLSDVVALNKDLYFEHPIYAGRFIERCQWTGSGTCLLSVRASSFEAVEALDQPVATIVPLDFVSQVKGSQFCQDLFEMVSRPSLDSASVVLSGGRGLVTVDAFGRLETLGNYLNAAVGATRAAVDAGLAPNDWQVGQTGKIVSPDWYIAFGISGAIQHIAGIKDSKKVVAINHDPEAPIFSVADYGLVADANDVIDQWINYCKQAGVKA